MFDPNSLPPGLRASYEALPPEDQKKVAEALAECDPERLDMLEMLARRSVQETITAYAMVIAQSDVPSPSEERFNSDKRKMDLRRRGHLEVAKKAAREVYAKDEDDSDGAMHAFMEVYREHGREVAREYVRDAIAAN